jgi:hypothetical protein
VAYSIVEKVVAIVVSDQRMAELYSVAPKVACLGDLD